jgi:hypothetical protein
LRPRGNGHSGKSSIGGFFSEEQNEGEKKGSRGQYWKRQENKKPPNQDKE